MKRLLLVASLVSLLGSPGSLAGQESSTPDYRSGFWIGFGLGPGHAQIDCSACGPIPAGDPWAGGTGLSAYLVMGGTPRPNLLLGGELNMYGKESPSSEREALLGSVALVAQYYPFASSQAFIRGGAGFGHYFLTSHYYTHSFLGRTASGLESTGFAVQGGAGYDLLLTRRLALVPFANLVKLLATGEIDAGTGAALSPSNPWYAHFGVGLHWY
jgi:hypothetical protein